MGDRIRFHFDPQCPWAWQGSKWIREVEKVRDVEVEWRLFSLSLINEGKDDPLADVHQKGTPALRTLALIRETGGNDAVGAVYKAIGERIHDRHEEPSRDTLTESLSEVGLDPGLVEQALNNDETMDVVRSEHEAAVDEAGCFGVPTIVLPSGRAIFGPVIPLAPTGEAAGELWDRVSWLADYDGFFELKRERDRKPGESKAS